MLKLVASLKLWQDLGLRAQGVQAGGILSGPPTSRGTAQLTSRYIPAAPKSGSAWMPNVGGNRGY